MRRLQQPWRRWLRFGLLAGINDGNTDDRDGCNYQSQVEDICGNGLLETGEQCDDADPQPMDGCDATYRLEQSRPHPDQASVPALISLCRM